MKAAKVFTRDNPCTKVDLHNAFFHGGDYRPTPVVEAKMVIGDNAPKYLLKSGYIQQTLHNGVDYYEPTADGKAWLRAGLARYLELHPDARGDVKGQSSPAKRIIRRSRG